MSANFSVVSWLSRLSDPRIVHHRQCIGSVLARSTRLKNILRTGRRSQRESLPLPKTAAYPAVRISRGGSSQQQAAHQAPRTRVRLVVSFPVLRIENKIQTGVVSESRVSRLRHGSSTRAMREVNAAVACLVVGVVSIQVAEFPLEGSDTVAQNSRHLARHEALVG